MLTRIHTPFCSGATGLPAVAARATYPPHVICIIGPVGSGKTLATEVLRKNFAYEEINTGQIVAELMGVPPVPLTPRGEFQNSAWAFISQPGGPERLATRLLEIANQKGTPRILIDGIRQRATLDSLRTIDNNRRVGIIFVHTPADLAFSFYADRIEQGASMNEFLSVRNSPVETEVEGLITLADAVLYNWTGRLQYRETIKAMMAEMGIQELGQ